MMTFLSTCKKTISIIIATLMLVLSLTCYAEIKVAAVNNSLVYKVYNATDGSFVKTYSLSANPVQDNSRYVFDSDDRVIDFTKSGVVKIISNAGGFGTGFIIDGHTIVTAAHCVANKLNASKNSNCGSSINKILVFDSNGNVEITITNAYQIHIPESYFDVPNNSGSNEYDYALITVPDVVLDATPNAEAIDLSAYAMFDLGVMLDGFIDSGKSVSVTGFPGNVNGATVNNNTNQHNMYTSVGNVCSDECVPDLQFCFTCDASPGNSGGPLYITTSYGGKVYYTVVGIVSGHDRLEGINWATRITTDLLHFYKNNSNKTWE